jgi:NAD(P)-dependent dehydrogenase (short-subunit alcohol dehydrogenase family)
MTRGLFDLTGKVALLTGASKGMGRAMAEALAMHGAQVMLSSRKLDQCEMAAAAINERCGEVRAHAFACNAGYKEQLQALVDATHERLGPVDVVIGNAGVNPAYGPMSAISDEAFDKITSSIGAFAPSLTLGTYNISKLAVIALVRNLAAELGPHGVRANAICPGLIRTDFAEALWNNPEAEANARRNIPLRRLGEADDLQGLAVYLASDASAYMTGQALTVCGGQSMWA